MGTGCLWWLTCGLFGIGQLLDFGALDKMVDRANAQMGAPTAKTMGGQIDQETLDCFARIQQGVKVALLGIASDQLTVEQAVKLIAVAVHSALVTIIKRHPGVPFDAHLEVTTKWLNRCIADFVPGMPRGTRDTLVALVLQEVVGIAKRQSTSRQSLEQSLGLIRDAMERTFVAVSGGKLSIDDGISVMGIAVAGALANCSISSREDLERHMVGFSEWMNHLAGQYAPGLSEASRTQFIARVWAVAITVINNS